MSLLFGQLAPRRQAPPCALTAGGITPAADVPPTAGEAIVTQIEMCGRKSWRARSESEFSLWVTWVKELVESYRIVSELAAKYGYWQCFITKEKPKRWKRWI